VEFIEKPALWLAFLYLSAAVWRFILTGGREGDQLLLETELPISDASARSAANTVHISITPPLNCRG
jgi:hypothetical protein